MSTTFCVCGGLSPRVRGNLANLLSLLCLVRSIPACAGEPCSKEVLILFRWVYPRVCGGTIFTSTNHQSPLGLSPRVRGNRIASLMSVCFSGSIPACAGEPQLHLHHSRYSKVYPRVCGGTTHTAAYSRIVHGLSPRVRGNQHWGAQTVPYPGSIPACAGEPKALLRLRHPERVYPRVCGGTRLN